MSKTNVKKLLSIDDFGTQERIPERWLDPSHEPFTEAVTKSVFDQCRAGSKPSPKMEDFLGCLTHGIRTLDFVPASNIRARQLLADLWEAKFLSLRAQLELSFYHITIVNDQDLTGSWSPRIDCRNTRRKASSVMSLFKGSYLGFGEIQLTNNVNQIENDENKGQVICPHYHIIGWSETPIDITETTSKMSRRFQTSENGIVPVRIDRLGDTVEDIQRTTQYLFKSPLKCKTFYKNDKTGKKNQHESMQGNRNIRLQRLCELLSLVDVRKLQVSSGDGVKYKSDVERAFKAQLALMVDPEASPLEIAQIESFWAELRARSKDKHKRYEAPLVLI